MKVQALYFGDGVENFLLKRILIIDPKIIIVYRVGSFVIDIF
jgi:hypothetical protein